jgi:renalase
VSKVIPKNVAVIGAGFAGSALACALSRAGKSVHVFDKARGPGGRLASRRLEWIDRDGRNETTHLDHGALGLSAVTPNFQDFIDQATRSHWLAEWTPTPAPGGLPLDGHARLHVPVPDMPSLCRHLVSDITSTWSFAVDRLHHDASGWWITAGDRCHGAPFDAVVVALPPLQAAPLISPHRSDWARSASIVSMHPCWTLIGVADSLEPAIDWDLGRPINGLLGWVVRSDRKPGRTRIAGQDHWVVHARAGWSRQHIEQPACEVLTSMQTALADYLGQPVQWQHCTAHRWRYALPRAMKAKPSRPSWWDAALGLGVCGDFFGDSGIEDAWQSARSLHAAFLDLPFDAEAPSSEFSTAIFSPPLTSPPFTSPPANELPKVFLPAKLSTTEDFQMNQPVSRRVFMMTLAASGAAFATGANAQAMVDEKDAQAGALGYAADAARVDSKKYTKYAAGQNCANCALYQGKAGDKAGGCPLFAGKQVTAAGWCSAWAKKG